MTSASGGRSCVTSRSIAGTVDAGGGGQNILWVARCFSPVTAKCDEFQGYCQMAVKNANILSLP